MQKIHAICLRKNGRSVPLYLDELNKILEFGQFTFSLVNNYYVGEFQYAIYVEK
jgi:hypothetical protein